MRLEGLEGSKHKSKASQSIVILKKGEKMPEQSEKAKCREVQKLVMKILKGLKNNTLDWTFQISTGSIHPEKPSYAVMISSPADGIQPITWVCEDYKELVKQLEIASKHLDVEAVERAWHQSEIERGKRLIKYHEEYLSES